jgi:hypothetical protein
MGAINVHHHLLQSYDIDRKSRIFLNFLNAAMVNAYIIYTQSFYLVHNPMPEKPLKPTSTKLFRCDVPQFDWQFYMPKIARASNCASSTSNPA